MRKRIKGKHMKWSLVLCLATVLVLGCTTTSSTDVASGSPMILPEPLPAGNTVYWEGLCVDLPPHWTATKGMVTSSAAYFEFRNADATQLGSIETFTSGNEDGVFTDRFVALRYPQFTVERMHPENHPDGAILFSLKSKYSSVKALFEPVGNGGILITLESRPDQESSLPLGLFNSVRFVHDAYSYRNREGDVIFHSTDGVWQWNSDVPGGVIAQGRIAESEVLAGIWRLDPGSEQALVSYAPFLTPITTSEHPEKMTFIINGNPVSSRLSRSERAVSYSSTWWVIDLPSGSYALYAAARGNIQNLDAEALAGLPELQDFFSLNLLVPGALR